MSVSQTQIIGASVNKFVGIIKTLQFRWRVLLRFGCFMQSFVVSSWLRYLLFLGACLWCFYYVFLEDEIVKVGPAPDHL